VILQVSANLIVEPDGRTWTVRGVGGPVYGLSNLRGVADVLVARRHLPAPQAQRYPAVLSRARELSPALADRLDSVRSLTFAAGGFTITRGNGDYILTNPTLEVARLPNDRDAQNRKAVVGYYASPGDALVAAVERSLQVCGSTLPYLALNETALAVASRLWGDLDSPADVLDSSHEGASSPVDRDNSDAEDVTKPPIRLDTVSRITCLPILAAN
jgi:hypothetical protein